MATPQEIAEYRKKNRFEVTCASGLKVLIRKIPIDSMFKVIEILQMKLSEGTSLEEAEKIAAAKLKSNEIQEHLPELIRIVVPVVAVQPHIKENPTDDKELAYDDVDYLDLIDIFFAAMEQTGLSKEASEARESFRKKHAGTASQGDVVSPPQAP